MANKDYTLPFQDLTNLVPSNLRNPMVKSLLDNLFNRFLTQDEAVPLYGYVGRKPASPDDRTPKVPQLSVERDINALIPVLSFKTGTETHSFTAQDLIRKAEVLGISEDQAQWLYSQGNNYAPPIDLDKFTNFFNYCWIAKALPSVPDLPWNPTAAPEYYTIAVPKLTDLDKLNVRAASTGATTLTGTGYLAQTWTITFTSDVDFTITTSDSTAPVPEQIQGPFTLPALTAAPYPGPWPTDTFHVSFTRSGAPGPLLKFNIVRDIVLDGAGLPLGYEAFAPGDTFTITAPFLASTYNITFTVGPGTKGKITAVNSLNIYQTVDGVLLKENDRVLVQHGLASVQGIYIVKPGVWEAAPDFDVTTASAGAHVFVTGGGQANSMFESFAAPGGYGWTMIGTNTVSNTNNWQEGNFWAKRDDLLVIGADLSKVIQAARPIIEYSANLQLNTRVHAGLPTDVGGTLYEQRKTEFNQVPLYDLFRYDGTHAHRASSLFFYAEDPTAAIDLQLQRRVKHADNASADFLFAHGMVEEDNGLLFYKDHQGELHTIWHPGYSTPTIVDQEYGGLGDGTLAVTVGSDPFSAQQIWTLTATGPFTFEVVGSKVKVLSAPYDVLTVGVPYSNGLFNATITAGGTPFEIGDNFKFRIGNFETTRYVYRDPDDTLYDLFGGAASDTAGVGAWQVPRMFFNNVAADNGDEVPEGTLYSHFRGILVNQLQTTAEDRAFGGSIKLWSEQQNLLASLLMQRDMTPISMIDLAQRQYEIGYNTIVDIFCSTITEYMNTNGVPSTTSAFNALVDYLLAIRAKDNDVRTVLYDSTSPVIGFPATLPQLGITPLIQPGVIFDNELGVELVQHHDGHLSPLFIQDALFRDRLEAGAAAYWSTVDIANILNEVMLIVEERLFNGISSEQRSYLSNTEVQTARTGDLSAQLKRELNTWAVQNGYDPTAPDYVSTDAFTWNYSSSITFAPVGGAVPARWFNALQAHHAAVSTIVAPVVPTSRPNLEPWKLLGNAVKPGTWDAMYRAALTPNDVSAGVYTTASATAVAYSAIPLSTLLSGLPVVDGNLLGAGQTVLLVSEANPANNGPWVISTGAWARASTPLAADTLFNIQTGNEFTGTQFVLLNNVLVVNTDPANFTQVRLWQPMMWSDIQTARPMLKLAVDTNRDALLPPYVSAYLPWGVNALTNVMPPDPAEAYLFGESSPVETVWVKSIEYRYSLARAAFRYDPLSFLGACWGFEWVSVDGILYDGYDIAVPGHPRFRLHGQAQTNISRSAPFSITLATGPADFVLEIVRDAYTATRAQSWSIIAGGAIVGHVSEGLTSTVTGLGYTLTDLRIEDEGRPFRLGDKFRLQANANGSGMIVSFEPFSYHVIHGLGQTFTQALRESSIDTNRGYAISAYKDWNINLGYRAGGLVSTDDLRVFTDNEALPESSYALRFKRSPYAKNLWAQALRVTVVQMGGGTLTGTGDNSAVIPAGDAADWTFRVEGYNARYLDLEYYTLDTAGEFSTFNALDQAHTITAWKNYTTITGTVSAQLPLTIVGLQNVVNLVYGYSRKMQDDGWVFNDDGVQNIDQVTGRVRNWQLEIEKLIDAVYSTGVRLGEGYILNPFIDRIWLDQDTGLLSKYYDSALFDVTAHPGVFDILGVKINTHDLTMLRQRGKSQISAVVPMYSVHAQIDEFEHLFVFNDLSSPSTNSGLIYDPFSGARISTIKLNGRRQASRTLRPEFGGHYLVGDEVRKNLQASTDKIAHYYDTDSVYEDEQSTKHALALLGFTPKKYMADLDLNDRTQFNFWRGLIQMKGTNASITAFLNNDRFEDAKLDEYWAYKVAEYGDSRSKLFPELKLTVDDTLQQFTKLIFDLPNPLAPPAGYEAFTNIISDDEARWFTIDDLSVGPVTFEAQVAGTYSNVVKSGDVVTLPFIADALYVETFEHVSAGAFVIGNVYEIITLGLPVPTDFTLIGATTNAVGTSFTATAAGTGDGVAQAAIATPGFSLVNARNVSAPIKGLFTAIGYGPATPKFNPVKLFNYVNPELIEEIPHWHPAIGQHTPAALESVNIISNKDPARYNVSTLVLGNSNYDPLRMWGTKEVGRVWWDTTNLDYLPYSDKTIFGSVDERLSRWGTLADYATVDVIEWVQSSVPPKDYDVQAAVDAGNADLDPRTRAEGTVYGAKTYIRDRVWSVRPIAWSEAGVATASAHPAFNGSYLSTLTFLNGGELVSLENGTFAQLGINAGMRIGAWQEDLSYTRPLSEFLVLDTFTKRIQRAGVAFTTFTSTFSGFTGQVTVQAYTHTDKVGVIRFQDDPVTAAPVLGADGLPTGEFDIKTFLRVVEDASGEEEIIAIRNDRGTSSSVPYGATFTTFIGQTFTFDIPAFGLRLTIKSTTNGSINSEVMVGFIASALGNDITLFDAVGVQRVVADPDPSVLPYPGTLSNDALDPVNSNNNGIGWRAWNVPTQAELDADSRVPDSKYYPYVGPYAAFTTTPVQTVLDGAADASFTLNNGTVIERYQTAWADWSELKQLTLRAVQTLAGVQPLVFMNLPTGTTADRLSVYVNGVSQLTGTYSLVGTTLTVLKVPFGQYVIVIVRPYAPTAAELAFDPAVVDNLLIQRQYKSDYQYVELPVRDDAGMIVSTKYFFWVKNRTSPAPKNDLSVKAVAQLLTAGPSQFLTFQNIQKPVDTWEYSALAINGLNYIVTKNDTFKLRFTRNFTLRDDPQQLDLKDTHVEWSLIRPGQRTKIPEVLWRKLVNTACGLDEAGNTLPSPRRSSYDDRNGTRTQFGFGADQVLAPTALVTSTLLFTVLNTQLLDESGTVPIPDYMLFLDFNESDTWFNTAINTRNTLTTIWNRAKVSQINELFFAVLEDMIASNYELSDLFKTSRLSAYSIKVVRPGPVLPSYE